jgi:hypothetical protein
MRWFAITIAVAAFLSGYAHADSIDDEIMAEALRITGEHKAKIDAEEQAQKAKEQELEKQREAQAEQIRKEAEEKQARDRMRQAALVAEEERKRREEEQRLRLIYEAELARKARIDQILHNMQQAVDAVDRKYEMIRARQIQEAQNEIMRRQQRDIGWQETEIRNLQGQLDQMRNEMNNGRRR